MALDDAIPRISSEQTAPGTSLQAFIRNGDRYCVAEIKVYKDGTIDCWGLVDFTQFKEKVRQGSVRTTLPDGARVSTMGSTLSFSVTEVRGGVEEAEFVKQVADAIAQLNGRPTSADICRRRFDEYRQDPTAKRKESLRVAYESVPSHMRCFLADIDTKDWE